MHFLKNWSDREYFAGRYRPYLIKSGDDLLEVGRKYMARYKARYRIQEISLWAKNAEKIPGNFFYIRGFQFLQFLQQTKFHKVICRHYHER